MKKVALGAVNLIDGAQVILSSSSAAGNNVISNVADSIIGRRHRLLAPGGWGQADFGAEPDVDVLCLRFPRDTALATGTVRHLLDADGGTAGAGALYDSGEIDLGLVDGYGYHVLQLPERVSARYWRWSLTLTSSFADIGRAWAGTLWSPATNMENGLSDEWDDLSAISTSERSGADFPDERARRRILNFTLGNLKADEALVAREMKRLLGKSRQILCIKDPDSPATETVIGRLYEINPIISVRFDINSTVFNLQEAV